MKNSNNEKGSVTLFVLIVCLFFIGILLLINIGLINSKTSKEKELNQILANYSQSNNNLDNVYLATVDGVQQVSLDDVQEIINESMLEAKLNMYPIGSIYITTNEQNPGEYIGGTWESYGQGRTLVGAGTGTDSNNTKKVFAINSTGGEYQHKLTTSEMPSHTHGINSAGQAGSTAWGYAIAWDGKAAIETSSARISNTGGSQSHNNIQPYVVTYMWRRVS